MGETKEVWNYETGIKAKIEINEFLFRHLPGSTTINEVEKLACNIFYQITKIWDKAIDKGA